MEKAVRVKIRTNYNCPAAIPRERVETIFGTVFNKPMIKRHYPTLPDVPTIRTTLNQIVVHAV